MLELDGQLRERNDARLRPVTLHAFPDGELHVEGAGRSLQLAARELRLGGRAADGSRALDLDDGARIAIAASDDFERWVQRHRGGGEGLVSARARRVARAAGSLALSALVIAGIVRFAVPAIASLLARAVPYSLDQELGDAVERALHEKFAASELTQPEQARVRALFERLTSYAHLVHPATLAFREGGAETGANAFALPNGNVIVTDELVALARSDDELGAVLAHELGHLHHRHGTRAVLQAMGIGALATGALGDFDGAGIASAVPMLLQLQYSRAFELEADAFSQRVLRDAGLDPLALGPMLARLEAESSAGAVPAWFSTHPSAEERRRALERAP
jgi:Zn-dependent protease with chaperone function